MQISEKPWGQGRASTAALLLCLTTIAYTVHSRYLVAWLLVNMTIKHAWDHRIAVVYHHTSYKVCCFLTWPFAFS